jgi:hypothetical protein
MQKEPAIPGVARGELKDKLARSEACLKMEGFYSSIRNLPDGVQRERILAKLKEIGMPAYRDWVEVENGRLKRVEFGFHGGTRLLEIKWLDPIRGMPIESLVLHATGVGDLGPLRGMPLKRLDLQLSRQVCDLSPLEGMALEALNCSSTGVSDLRPLKGMKLRELVCNNTRVTDLGPLEGMPLEVLSCTYTGVTKLAPLRGMPLRTLVLAHCQVADLTPLEGMPLNELMCPGTVVSDLGPLRGMPLTTLYVAATQVRDLSPLAGMKLQWLAFHPQNIKKGMDVVRAMKSINRITVGLGTLHLGVHDFWKRYDAGEFSK